MGRSGLKVSRACLGTMNFGTASGLAACDESEARTIIDAFLAAGVAAQLSASATAVALAWTAAQPAITSVIIGPRSQDQLQQNLAGFSLDLPVQALAHLTTISDPAERPVTGSVL
jgi:aryl-alcohol dehydrogenase-like predicted oxidoreductase